MGTSCPEITHCQVLLPYMYILLVPDEPPIFNAFTNIGTTSFTINWFSPPPQSQNGAITMYTIDITGDPFPFTGPPLSYSTDGSYPAITNLSLEITGLEEYNDYIISIAAVNSVGAGTYTAGDLQTTFEAGKIIEYSSYVCCKIFTIVVFAKNRLREYICVSTVQLFRCNKHSIFNSRNIEVKFIHIFRSIQCFLKVGYVATKYN